LTTRSPFFDTNVLVYAFVNSESRTIKAQHLLSEGAVVSVQILNEFAAVMRRKFDLEVRKVAELIAEILVHCPQPRPLTLETHRAGMRLCERYGFSIYDGTMIASALEAGCRVLHTEDLQHGQAIEGLRIVNPFL
jgi:predicted nucleic acid-binding protein